MLMESDVIEAVCRSLSKHGYTIEQKLSVREHGIDIVASKVKPRRRILIEAKGETSSNRSSKRYGRPFNPSQVLDHVAKALFQSVAVLTSPEGPGHRLVAIALPDNSTHRACIAKIAVGLQSLKIGVFWVRSDCSVIFQLPWRL